MASLAEQYDARYGGVDIPEAQKAERMERLVFKEEHRAHHRTGRNRGVIFNGRAGATLDRIFGGAQHGRT
mgnify:CR=1 FL=1